MRRTRPALALMLLVSLLWAGLPLPVLAQGGTVLAVDPAQSSVEVNGQREIHLLVTDADNLNAFDVQVEYDSGLLSLAKWEFGDLLSNLAVVKRDDLPGSFRLVATQLATPGVSGDGVLLKLFFRGEQTGSSAITITKAEFARSEGGLSLPELEHGSITVIPAQPTATATRTPTATATLAPTVAATLTPTATPTATRTATLAPSATATATQTITATVAGTQAVTATPAATVTAPGAAVTLAPTGPAGTFVTPVGGTDEPAATAQPEPTRAEGEGGNTLPEAPGQDGSSNVEGGGGYVLRKSSDGSPSTLGVVLFIAGLLTIGAAAVVYSVRKTNS